MVKYIHVNCPAYRGAERPMFDPMKINESEFEDDMRFKNATISLDVEANRGSVDWLSQEIENHSEAFNKEVLRAFKANGAKPGMKIEVNFGSRDTGYIENYELIV